MSVVCRRWPLLAVVALTLALALTSARPRGSESAHAAPVSEPAAAEAAVAPAEDTRFQVAQEPELAPEGGGLDAAKLPGPARKAIDEANARDAARRAAEAPQADVYHQGLVKRAAQIEAERVSGVAVTP